MKAEAGWGAAALVAVAAVVGINSQSGGKAGTGSAEASRQSRVQSAAKAIAGTAFESGPCGSLEGTIRTFLLVDKSQIAAPASCYGDLPAKEEKPAPGAVTIPKQPTEYERDQTGAHGLHDRAQSLHYVIAILPDPLHTHFSLSFDREAEAIQQGAQDEGYFYDSSWLPWQTGEQPLALLADQDKEEEETKAREEQPGILLFRKRQEPKDQNLTNPKTLMPYGEGLAVLLVGEEPTSGIHKHQFENAVAWIDALQPLESPQSASPTQPSTHVAPPHAVKILGPSFSGSLPSLAQILIEEPIAASIRTLNKNAPDKKLSIYSGSITSNPVVDWFTAKDRGIGEVRFRSFQQDGDTQLALYRNYLYQQGFEVSHLAVISEDETAYGGNTGIPGEAPCPLLDFEKGETVGPTCLFYPRDLSALREAYQKQGIFSVDSGQAGDASQRQLASDLADPEGKEHDTIRNYSGGQTALSQEAVLKQIVSVLRSHQSEYLVLRSSNPLDQLFLSYFLRRTYPEGRVVIAGSDLLLRRENGTAALSGIMTLTNYPLLPVEFHWTSSAIGAPYLHGHRVFAQEAAESTYVATRFLLHPVDCAALSAETFLPPTCGETRNALAISDYAPPFWLKSADANRPSTWVSVLGRDGFWPVAALPRPDGPALSVPQQCPKEEKISGWQALLRWMHGLAGGAGGIFISAWSLLSQMPRAAASLGKTIFWILTPWLDSSVKTGCRPPWPAMPVSMQACMLAMLLLAVFHFFCCARPSLTVKPVHRANFAWVRNDTHPGLDKSHTALIVFGSVVLALIPTLMAWGYGEMSPDGEPIPHAWRYRVFLPLIWIFGAWAVGCNAWVESKEFPRGKDAASSPGVGERLAAAYARLRALAKREPTALTPWKAAFRPVSYYLLATLVLYLLADAFLDQQFGDFNRIPAYWRAINLTTGVSPLVPLLALAAGLYLWFWYSLQGLALFGDDRPVLPPERLLRISIPAGGKPEVKKVSLLSSRVRLYLGWQSKAPLLCMFSGEQAGQPIEDLCGPFAPGFLRVAIGAFLAVGAIGLLLAGGEPPIRSLGPKSYSTFFCIFMDLCISLTLANAWQLRRIWLALSQLLVFLDRVPMRRTMKALQDISWGSIWKMSGSVLDLRYRLISRQIESLTHLHNSLQQVKTADAARWLAQVQASRKAQFEFAVWYAGSWNNWKDRDLSRLRVFQESVAETAAMMLSEPLVDHWRSEAESLALDLSLEIAGTEKDRRGPNPVLKLPVHIRDAEELVCLVYIGFIQNVLGRMRTLGMQMLWLFVAATVSVATYPFDPRPATSGALFVLFLVLGAAIVSVYSQMHRDATLSMITNTNPGELGTEFWFKLISFGAGPAIGLAATIFPDLTGSLFSWLQPGLAALK